MRKIIISCFVAIVFMTSVSAFAADSSGSNYKIKKLANQLYEKKYQMVALRRLLSYRKEAVPYAVLMLEEKKDDFVQISALKIIEISGDASLEDKVIKKLSSTSNRVKKAAGKALASIGTKKSIPYLKKLLYNYDPDVRYSAMMALARIAPEAQEKTVFINSLGDIDPRVRKYAVIALAKAGDETDVSVLNQVVRDFDPGVRMELTNTLGAIGTENTLPALSVLLGDPEQGIRNEAITNIGKIKGAKANAVLIQAAGNSDPAIAAIAVNMLVQRNSADALKVAKNHLDSENMIVRTGCIDAIGAMGKKEDLSVLRPLLKAESTLVRKHAVMAINKIEKVKK